MSIFAYKTRGSVTIVPCRVITFGDSQVFNEIKS